MDSIGSAARSMGRVGLERAIVPEQKRDMHQMDTSVRGPENTNNAWRLLHHRLVQQALLARLEQDIPTNFMGMLIMQRN